MIVYEPYSPTCCQMHCSDAMLPVDGEADETDGLRLLYATDWVPCPACGVGLNPDLDCQPEAVAAAVPTVLIHRSHCYL